MSTYTPIASITLASATSEVTFSGIPQTYTDLVMVMTGTIATGGAGSVRFRFNGDTTSVYSNTRLLGDGTTASSTRNTSESSAIIGVYSDSTIGNNIISIMNYSNSTTYKTCLFRNNVTDLRAQAGVALWRNTSAITSITVLNGAGLNFTVGSTFNLYGIANASITNVAKATGGDSVYTDGTYWYHIFRSSGTFTPTQALTADYLVVAGGGGGGYDGAGGGGAGGYRAFASQSLTVQNYTVTVGAGGAGSTSSASVKGSNGSTSTFGSNNSSGGGGGGSESSIAGSTGGSGGGARGSRDAGASGAAGNSGGYSPAEGNSGGAATNPAGNIAGSGGGGASAAGKATDAASPGSGDGGAGTAWLNGTTYAGGGGGGGATTATSANRGRGGSGGGGRGGINDSGGTYPDSVAGTANTGGGGGGGGGSPGTNLAGASGGSGIVIVRYAA